MIADRTLDLINRDLDGVASVAEHAAIDAGVVQVGRVGGNTDLPCAPALANPAVIAEHSKRIGKRHDAIERRLAFGQRAGIVDHQRVDPAETLDRGGVA